MSKWKQLCKVEKRMNQLCSGKINRQNLKNAAYEMIQLLIKYGGMNIGWLLWITVR